MHTDEPHASVIRAVQHQLVPHSATFDVVHPMIGHWKPAVRLSCTASQQCCNMCASFGTRDVISKAASAAILGCCSMWQHDDTTSGGSRAASAHEQAPSELWDGAAPSAPRACGISISSDDRRSSHSRSRRKPLSRPC